MPKERIFSFRDLAGTIKDPKNQRPELWNIFNGRVEPGESIRVFPLSNWTEMDVCQCASTSETVRVMPLYFAKGRARGAGARKLADHAGAGFRQTPAGRSFKERSSASHGHLGCSPCARRDAVGEPIFAAASSRSWWLREFRRGNRGDRSLTGKDRWN